jgi:hypothetical protein
MFIVILVQIFKSFIFYVELELNNKNFVSILCCASHANFKNSKSIFHHLAPKNIHHPLHVCMCQIHLLKLTMANKLVKLNSRWKQYVRERWLWCKLETSWCTTKHELTQIHERHHSLSLRRIIIFPHIIYFINDDMNYIKLTQIQWTPLKSLETLKLWIILFCEFTKKIQMDFNIIVFQIVDHRKKIQQCIKILNRKWFHPSI